jgi:glycosyltransferase involved in cell wall biosynthesis
MKILVVHSELGVLRGGGENFTKNLFTALARRGHDVFATFIADSKGRYPIALSEEMKPIPLAGYWSRKLGQETLSSVARRIPPGTALRATWDRLQAALCWRTVQWHDRRFACRIQQDFSKRWEEFDVVYVHSSPFLASHVARHCPTVLGLPGPVSAELAPVLKMSHAVCINGDAFTQVRKFLGDHAVELPLGLEDVFRPGSTQVRERLGWTRNNWVIGYVGRLAFVKGVDLLVDAFKDLQKTIPAARLLIVGTGEEEAKLRSRLRPELAEGIAHFEDDVPHESLADWYRAMDLFVMPSRYENLSNAVLEAMACGVPFLGSDVGGNRNFVEMEGGWLFAHGSVDSLTKTLCSLAENPCRASDQGRLTAQKVRQKYKWETSAKRLEEIFQSCIKLKMGIPCMLKD